MRLFVGDTLEDTKTKRQYVVTRFVWGKFHMLELNHKLYSVISIDDGVLKMIDVNGNVLLIGRCFVGF